MRSTKKGFKIAEIKLKKEKTQIDYEVKMYGVNIKPLYNNEQYWEKILSFLDNIEGIILFQRNIRVKILQCIFVCEETECPKYKIKNRKWTEETHIVCVDQIS